VDFKGFQNLGIGKLRFQRQINLYRIQFVADAKGEILLHLLIYEECFKRIKKDLYFNEINIERLFLNVFFYSITLVFIYLYLKCITCIYIQNIQ